MTRKKPVATDPQVDQQVDSQPRSQEPPQETMQLVTFLLGNDEYGFHIEHVQEIVRLKNVTVTEIPNAPKMIEGVVNLRGRLIPVVDLRKRFSRKRGKPAEATRVIVANVGNRTIGLTVDAVLEVARVAQQLEDLPDLAAGAGAEFVEGVSRVARGLVVVLDLDRMFSDTETDAMRGIAT